jgi:hypothetical protein
MAPAFISPTALLSRRGDRRSGSGRGQGRVRMGRPLLSWPRGWHRGRGVVVRAAMRVAMVSPWFGCVVVRFVCVIRVSRVSRACVLCVSRSELLRHRRFPPVVLNRQYSISERSKRRVGQKASRIREPPARGSLSREQREPEGPYLE